MDIFHFLQIFSFEDPEPLATPTPETQTAVTKITNGVLAKISELTGFSEEIIFVILAVILVVFLLLVLVLILAIARKSRKKATSLARPAPMARPPVTRPVPGKPQTDTSINNSTPPSPAERNFGLQFTLPDGKITPLNILPSTIGRGSGNTVVIDSETVSTIHARVYYDPALQAVCIEDQNSLNGLKVNGKPTHKNILNDGDKITVGDITLVFQDNGYIPS